MENGEQSVKRRNHALCSCLMILHIILADYAIVYMKHVSRESMINYCITKMICFVVA